MNDWHILTGAEVLSWLDADPAHGLSESDAKRRLAEQGFNELTERGIKSPWLIVWEQLTATMVMILIIAAAISVALGDYKDAAAIAVIVVLNALIGFRQEYGAEKAMAALKRLAVPTVKVRRGGHVQEVSARELVPGDIILLEAGNLIPADCRLLDTINLRIQEAALTGESEPVDKKAQAVLDSAAPIADRINMAYMGTVVAYGRGQAVVSETGMKTQLGNIAEMIQKVEQEPTPLQRKLNQLGKGLAIAALALVAIVFVLGLLRGEEVKLMLLTSISLAVAAVPEGLPAVVTIALALGAQRMLKRRALIRKLPAVETLGSVTVICSDKTGTLTENQMTVAVLDAANNRIDISEYLPHSESGGRGDCVPKDKPTLVLLLIGGALCNDAFLERTDGSPGPINESEFHAIGDPTEAALVVAAARFGLCKGELEPALPRVAEVPFDSERKRMTTLHEIKASGLRSDLSELICRAASAAGETCHVAFTKGAVDSLLDVSNSVLADERVLPLDTSWRNRILEANDRLAQKGMRVLGIAFKPLGPGESDETTNNVERNLIFIGMVGMIDPPRVGVKEAVATCKAAGIRPVIITGDHALTAKYIARELGIAGNEQILSGQDLDRLSIKEIEDRAEHVSVYARVSPEHKLNIVQALQNRGHIVAMTGDGINDAPALKRADIGVAMGITGTDVAKEAADMVLLDDNFATIVAAVEEGRVIFDNLRKFVKYILTTNSAELCVVLLAPFTGMPLPLLPLQILWLNLVTDGLPALALSLEPADRQIMHRPPYQPGESVFARGLGLHVVWVGLLMALISIGVGYVYWYDNQQNWQTMLFTTLTVSQMGHVLAIRSERDSLFKIGVMSNRPLLGAVVLTVLLQVSLVYIPPLQEIFKTVALSAKDLAICLSVSSIVFCCVEIEKWLRRGLPRQTLDHS
jgi:Ca2+-transporting ATPase